MKRNGVYCVLLQRQEGKMLNAKKAFKVTVVSSFRLLVFLNFSVSFIYMYNMTRE